MKRPLLRLGLLCVAFALTAAVFLVPPPAVAASCPTATCASIAAYCNGVGCGVGVRPIGTCVNGSGNTVTLYLIECPGCNIYRTCVQ